MTSWWHRLRRWRLDQISPAEGYRRWAPEYGREPNAFQRLEAEALERLLPDVTGHRVLDLGCGKGRVGGLALERGASRVIAADLSLAMLGRAAIGAPKLAATAGGPLPFRPATFDTVVCALVLGHVDDLALALRSMADVLRPEGYLVLSDFHPYATLRGWQRTFVDPTSGATRAIVQHLHMLSDYVTAFGRLIPILGWQERTLGIRFTRTMPFSGASISRLAFAPAAQRGAIRQGF